MITHVNNKTFALSKFSLEWKKWNMKSTFISIKANHIWHLNQMLNDLNLNDKNVKWLIFWIDLWLAPLLSDQNRMRLRADVVKNQIFFIKFDQCLRVNDFCIFWWNNFIFIQIMPKYQKLDFGRFLTCTWNLEKKFWCTNLLRKTLNDTMIEIKLPRIVASGSNLDDPYPITSSDPVFFVRLLLFRFLTRFSGFRFDFAFFIDFSFASSLS